MRARPAPRARRIVTSRCRAVVRASSRLATFAQAIGRARLERDDRRHVRRHESRVHRVLHPRRDSPVVTDRTRSRCGGHHPKGTPQAESCGAAVEWVGDQPELTRPGDGFGAVGRAELAQQMADMLLDRVQGDHELARDGLIRRACASILRTSSSRLVSGSTMPCQGGIRARSARRQGHAEAGPGNRAGCRRPLQSLGRDEPPSRTAIGRPSSTKTRR